MSSTLRWLLAAFLVVLNGFFALKKAHIDAFLSLVLVGLLITVFESLAFQRACSRCPRFLYAALARPLAARSVLPSCLSVESRRQRHKSRTDGSIGAPRTWVAS